MRVVELEGKSVADDIICGTVFSNDDQQEAWRMCQIEVPADGSCFFRSVAIAINDNIDAWYQREELRVKMERYWEEYSESAGVKEEEVTASLVRYMCAENIDIQTLEIYNAEAEYRKNTLKERDVFVYKDLQEFRTHVLKPDTWVDHASFAAFLKSLDFMCGLVVFDPECEGIKYLPPEWTVRKSLYIFLMRKRNHYTVMRLEKEGRELGLCVSYEDTKEFVDWMTTNSVGNVLSEF